MIHIIMEVLVLPYVAYNLICYFDEYRLQSCKYTSYKKWRACYKLITQNKHLKEKGLKIIIKFKESLNKHSNL